MRQSTLRSSLALGALVVVTLGAECGGGGGTDPDSTPPVMGFNSANNQNAIAGTAVGAPPSVKVVNSSGQGVAGVAVTFALVSGGGSLTGENQTTNSAGVATVGSWTVGSTPGANTVKATASGTTGGPLNFSATGAVGPATTIAVNAGDGQTVTVGTAVSVAPSVKVTDVAGNPVTGTPVTFAIGTGGGSITGGSQTTNSSGIAAVGSWTPGTVGANTLTATSTGLTGSPITFTATGEAGAAVVLTSVSPSLLTPSVSATISGSGFNTTLGSNTVTVDGVSATVTAATASSLTFTVPAAMPCEATHDATISVTVLGNPAQTISKPLQVATSRSLNIGQAIVVTAAGEQRCNELTNTGTSRYYIAISNTNTAYNTTGASFELRGAAGSGASGASPSMRSVRQQPAIDASRGRLFQPLTPEQIAERMHMRVLEQNIRYLREHRTELTPKRSRGALLNAVSTTPTVGTTVSINIPNLNNANICTSPLPMTGRIVYVGSKSVIVEDNDNPGAGTLDTMYARVGGEFDNTMFPILTGNYGNPLAMDASTDNNGRLVMVFSRKINENFLTLAGFVVTCDFATAASAGNTQTNTGEYFYARSPLFTSGTLSTVDSPAYWNWTMRPTIIHEVKHIVSFAEHLSRGASSFEESWLEETTARMSEELYERSVYSFSVKSNIGYGSAANQVGPYCGVRGCGTPAKARGIIRVFEDLGPEWYATPELYSPLGRIDANDFSFYSTGWSLVRWAIDQSATDEATFLKALTQETSLTGVANLQARTGRTFADMLPEWNLAMVLDDYPGFTASGAPATRMAQPSWNFRSVFSGYKTDFPSASFASWPLLPYARGFGTFTLDVSNVRPGTSAIVELSGTATAKQLLELKANGSSAAAPAELRIAIVRVQ